MIAWTMDVLAIASALLALVTATSTHTPLQWARTSSFVLSFSTTACRHYQQLWPARWQSSRGVWRASTIAFRTTHARSYVLPSTSSDFISANTSAMSVFKSVNKQDTELLHPNQFLILNTRARRFYYRLRIWKRAVYGNSIWLLSMASLRIFRGHTVPYDL